MRKLVIGFALFGVLSLSMVKVVHTEGDHTSYLVLAPYPSLRFSYGGGEEGAWQRAHPGEERPWWLSGRFIVLGEVTDG